MEDSVSSPPKNSSIDKKNFWDYFKFLVNSSSTTKSKRFSATIASFLLLFLFICTFLSTRWSDISTMASRSREFTFSMFTNNNKHDYPKRDEYLLNCTSSNMTITCPANYPPSSPSSSSSSSPSSPSSPSSSSSSSSSNRTCPEYFRWIHEDLKTWKKKGITRKMVESLKKSAHFRLVIVNGTAYIKRYSKAFQTRDEFTLWGILQLLKLYPGRLPDLDLMFQCHDQASIKKHNFNGINSAFAPPQFHYCGDDSTLDIVFPDWSFWGWPEVNIKPWVPLAKDLEEGNTIKNWSSREPYAFWKGNLHTGPRHKLGVCNSIEKWNARIVGQDWGKEKSQGFKNSDLSKQCVHRYKIYMEGNAWSVSEKYILACDSMTLRINPTYYDFLGRSLIPMKHYWPVNPNNLCRSIQFAVNWGNNHTHKAQEIGKAGSEFLFDQMNMENVYDYMFHVLYEYAKLLNYRPTVPQGAVELCSEKFACSPMGLQTKYKIQTMVNGPSQYGPCELPPPYDPHTLESLLDQNTKIKELVEMWEKGSS